MNIPYKYFSSPNGARSWLVKSLTSFLENENLPINLQPFLMFEMSIFKENFGKLFLFNHCYPKLWSKNSLSTLMEILWDQCSINLDLFDSFGNQNKTVFGNERRVNVLVLVLESQFVTLFFMQYEMIFYRKLSNCILF